MFIPYGKQNINQTDIDSVVKVLRSDWLTQGPSVELFETAAKLHHGADYCCAVNSATSALHIACLALNLGKNDWLWTSPNTFAASANCGLYCGARIDFVDIDPNTFNMCVQKLKVKLEAAEKTGTLPKVVVPVHFGGLSCDMETIHKLSIQYGFNIIEDASHAVGGSYSGHSVGSCAYSDITVLSFHPVKIITTGEGGMAITNDPQLAEKMALLRCHGITRDAAKMSGDSHGDWYYEQIDLGLNYRMTDIQAALGASQYSRLDEFVAGRNRIATRYNERLADFPVSTQKGSPETCSAYHLFVIKLTQENHVRDRKHIFRSMREAGIGVNVHYIPVHTHPHYKKMGFNYGDFPEAERYYEAALSIPMYPDLTDKNQDYVLGTLRRSLDL
jgi:UDP-4-amino-4,6-dideoxy-N-acetyl-beta-L-altrosamine transaminase